CASGSLQPSPEKILIPLSVHGLCEAEITTPASNPCERARNATPGVVITPALRVSTPTDVSPCRKRSAIHRLETRVSCPITTPALAFTRTRSCPGRRPIQKTRSRVSENSPGTPRIPSVPKSCLVCVMPGPGKKSCSLLAVVFRAFHDNRHANRGGVHNLDQRIGDIGLRHKSSLRHGSANVRRIRGGGLHCVDTAAGAGDLDSRRIGNHPRHSHAAGKISGHTRSHLDDAPLEIVKREVKLTGYDLHHLQILRHMHLPAGQIESPFPRADAGQINLRPHIRNLQPVNHTLRS